jgi:hypothetical protein
MQNAVYVCAMIYVVRYRLSTCYARVMNNLLDSRFRGNDERDPIGARHAGPGSRPG